MLPLTPYRNPIYVALEGGRRVGTQSHHEASPLRSMGFDPARSITLMNRVMGYLVGYGVIQMQAEVSCEQPTVKPKPAALFAGTKHAGGSARQVKAHWNPRQRNTNKLLGPAKVGAYSFEDKLPPGLR